MDKIRIDALIRTAYQHQEAGDFDTAEEEYRRIIAIDPRCADALYMLGELRRGKGHLHEAFALLERATATNREPAYAVGWNDLGSALQERDRLDDALAAFRRAIDLDPALPQPCFNLGLLLRRLGQPREAADLIQRAVDLYPDRPASFSELLLTLYFLEDCPAESFLQKHREYGRRFTANLPAVRLRLERGCVPGQPIRIGIVSADLRRNSVAFFVEPVLRHIDRERFEITCYYSHTIVDDTTLRLKSYAPRWVDCAVDTDEELAQRIARDHIDVLIDWSGHVANNRLQMFARRPAPLQITAANMLTGVEAMDYRLSDRVLDSPGLPVVQGAERPLRLPGCFWCFQPLESTPDVAPSPAMSGGRVTFGSFNHAGKLSPSVVRLWARILHAIPGSTLVLKAGGFSSATARDYFRNAFELHGIGPERLRMTGMYESVSDHLATYGSIDVALDPFPFNGATTNCEALWMGVPFVTLEDRSSPSPAARAGASLLRAVQLDELVARDIDDYLRIAIALATDLERLSSLRMGMRERMLKTGLTDGPRYASDFGALLERAAQQSRAGNL